MILSAETALRNNTQLINELNVFPVPDGDTGTNMSLTMRSAAEELKKKSFRTIDEVASCAANALLRGARGNSGVITSLLFRGIAKRLKGLETAGTAEFAGALNDGVESAYKAVMKPAEGTILTVSRLASKAAADAANYGSDMEGLFICALKAGEAALLDTKEINPVLKKAGVVDAGGKGYMVILSAMYDALRGVAVTPAEENDAAEESVFEAFSTEEITFTYDTVFIIRKTEKAENLDAFRAYLETLGDCIVIGESDDAWKVHVHTDVPGEVLTESAKYGTLELCKIENMRMQHDDLVTGRNPRSTDNLDAEPSEAEGAPAAPEKEYGIVTVCAGAGMEELFRELGADSIVTGGQTMNPSTQDILKAVNRTPAETVFVLPNNKNIIMAAEQCIPLAEKNVVVIPTKTVPQGITAMLNFDASAEQESVISQMEESIGSVHTAMITYAARDSDFDGHIIHSGEYLALLDGSLTGNYANLKTAVSELTWSFNDLNPAIITVYYGEDVTEQEAEEMSGIISGVFPEADVSVVNGGQPVYYYMISIE